MMRSMRAAEAVDVYASAEAKAKGQPPLKTVHLVAYSMHGLDNYRVDDVMYPGYWNNDHACVFLDHPLPMLGGIPS
jgi:hypothetical protein